MKNSVDQQIVLAIDQELIDAIARHGEASYPHECCGILLGTEAGAERRIGQLIPIENGWDAGEREKRFLIRSEDVLRAERAARAAQLDVLGFYHSHPDAPARPSEFDREHAWPWYTYLIASIRAGRFDSLLAWQLQDDRSAYRAVSIA